jgi:hypothetical protein
VLDGFYFVTVTTKITVTSHLSKHITQSSAFLTGISRFVIADKERQTFLNTTLHRK